MHPRAAELIRSLGLETHPEGGYYREVFRSPSPVNDLGRGVVRNAVTQIWFLLTRRDVSRWHRVASEELWHFCEGAPLEHHLLDLSFLSSQITLLGPLLESRCTPFRVVPRDRWQAARTKGEYTLVSCTVSPGFSFEDFTLLSSSPERSRLGDLPELLDLL
jgi:predicted cupin superfamily sugar epimerase